MVLTRSSCAYRAASTKRHCSWRLRVLSSISKALTVQSFRNKLGIWLNDDAADREDAHQSVDTCVWKDRRQGSTMPFTKAHWRVHPGLCRTAILSVNQCMGLELRHPLRRDPWAGSLKPAGILLLYPVATPTNLQWCSSSTLNASRADA